MRRRQAVCQPCGTKANEDHPLGSDRLGDAVRNFSALGEVVAMIQPCFSTACDEDAGEI
jgi:hypothetical protein